MTTDCQPIHADLVFILYPTYLVVFDSKESPLSMSRSHRILRLMRTIHLYFGVFISPALLFFAFTGALQTFSLHETGRDSNYQPPKWIMTLAQLHKKQTVEVPQRRPRPASPDTAAEAHRRSTADGVPGPSEPKRAEKTPEAAGPKPNGHLPMKIFFLIVSIGLFTSTLTGIYMAYRFSRGVWTISGLLAAGVVLPLLLLPF